jgi:hypothetical protein
MKKGPSLFIFLFTNTIITNSDIQQFTDMLGLDYIDFFETYRG